MPFALDRANLSSLFGDKQAIFQLIVLSHCFLEEPYSKRFHFLMAFPVYIFLPAPLI